MGTSQLVEALNRFTVDHQHPFQKERLDSILRSKGIMAQSITTTKTDTMVWQPSMLPHTSIWQPVMTVSFPYDIFEGQQVVVKTAIGMSPIIRRMTYTLLITILLSFFLVFCLIYQILTIRKQRHIEAIRQEFLHTMIHELKRPISTLKMCVSFMSNERMMQDGESKQKILNSSYNELDNLTSYFSKLRDITFSDSTEIPLVKSRFALRGLMEECISKQNIPSDKEVRMEIVAEDDLKIQADRMHLASIVCNLLENAIKYSIETVAIRIDYRMREDGMVQISVADNGIGVAKADRLKGFDLKGNDYIPKPFYPEELIEKIKERFEHRQASLPSRMTIGQTIFDSNLSTINFAGRVQHLSARQSEILAILAQHIGQTVERSYLLEHVWGNDSYANSLALNVQITYIRKLLEPDTSISIVSLKKRGYRLEVM